MNKKNWDVFLETGISIVLPENIDPNSKEGYSVFKKAVVKKFKEILNGDQVDFQWEQIDLD